MSATAVAVQEMVGDRPVRLLEDSEGLYGLEVRTEWGSEASLIMRPDELRARRQIFVGAALLQQIPRIWFRSPPQSIEATVRDAMHRAFMPPGGFQQVAGESHGRERVRRLRAYHASRDRATRMTNSLFRRVLAVADPTALTLARRFPRQVRAGMYGAAVLVGERWAQLAVTFPQLAAMIVGYTDETERRQQAIRMVADGARLRDVAGLMDVPMSWRRILPGAVRLYTPIDTELLASYLPKTVRAQRQWLSLIHHVGRISNDREFVRWVAAHAGELGPTAGAAAARLSDLHDWVKASRISEVLTGDTLEQVRALLPTLELLGGFIFREEHLMTRASRQGTNFVTRRFTPRMAVSTVLRLSAEWHEAVAASTTDGELIQFSAAWLPAGEVGEYRIEPLVDSAELHRAARILHNCGSTYLESVRDGACYLYAIREGDTITAMLEVDRAGDTPRLAQLKGKLNGPVSKPLAAAVKKWFRRHAPAAVLPPPAPPAKSPFLAGWPACRAAPEPDAGAPVDFVF